jgi:hypothetical protein
MLWYVLEMYKQGIMLLRATSARPIDLILSPPVNLPFLGFVIGGAEESSPSYYSMHMHLHGLNRKQLLRRSVWIDLAS